MKRDVHQGFVGRLCKTQVLTLLVIINLIIWGIVLAGCAVRGLHLDEATISGPKAKDVVEDTTGLPSAIPLSAP